ncbi:MAG: LacI family transcriptional regulator [Lachnospiraceae bacterium]|nr:LacI family transcriptional regulator [Lachnospiraceae bacterium]
MESTIKDIKRETGLALSTISKYLNGGNVRPENKKKIDDAVRKLDYHPNEMARGLITKKTRTIGFLLYDISGTFAGILTHHVGTLLRQRGYGMIICDSSNDKSVEEQNVKFLADKKVDGLLVVPVSSDDTFLEPIKKANIPIVTIDRKITGTQLDCVTIDNEEAAKNAVEYLIERGHERIAAIYSEEYTGKQRRDGYRKAMRSAGITISGEYEYHERLHSVSLGYNGMQKFLKLPKKSQPTAIFMSNYEVALGVVMAINEAGISCPEDISLVGFDELTLTLVMKPKMTLMVQPMESIANEAVRILMSKLQNENSAALQRVLLYASLNEGDSVRDLRKR